MPTILGRARHVLAVVAHPDDESFGLGGIIAALVDAGVTIDLLCLTHGEASTLGRAPEVDLGRRRAEELDRAGQVLGVRRCELHDWPDGALGDHPVAELAEPVAAMVAAGGIDALLAFDESGVTGHPDHRRATQAARSIADRADLDLHAWALPDDVAVRLNGEFGTTFAGRPRPELQEVAVDRERQRRAIACHASQATVNPVLWRRLELAGTSDHLVALRRARDPGSRGT